MAKPTSALAAIIQNTVLLGIKPVAVSKGEAHVCTGGCNDKERSTDTMM